MPAKPSLTTRQQQVLELMVQGLPTRLIAEQLGVSVNTVKEHRGLILKRTGVDNTVALIHQLQQAERSTLPPELVANLAKPPDVLVVEDDDLYRELVVSGLKMAGFGSRGVSCSTDMTAAFSGQAFDVVVLDLNLGEEDGLVIARDLRELQPSLGIIMMTTRGMVDQRIEGLLVGADVYLVKPVDIRELVGTIRNLFRRVVESRTVTRR